MINFNTNVYARVKIWTEYPVNDESWATVRSEGWLPERHDEHETIFKPNHLIDFFDSGQLSWPYKWAQFDVGYYPRLVYVIVYRNGRHWRHGYEFDYYTGPRLKLETNYDAINAYKRAGY